MIVDLAKQVTFSAAPMYAGPIITVNKILIPLNLQETTGKWYHHCDTIAIVPWLIDSTGDSHYLSDSTLADKPL